MTRKSSVKPWLLAARPKTLPAAVAPVLIGTALAFADGKEHWPSAILAAICSLLLQIGANYANDYFDFIKGTDSAQRLGPTRATAAGWVRPQAMLRAFIIVFALAACIGIYPLIRGGLPILLIGIFSITAAVLYTGGPKPLGYIGLGDLFVFVFFGLIAVGGTYYIQTLSLNWMVMWAACAPGFLSTAILTVNNLRDIANDSISGKHTLPVQFGSAFGRLEYLICLMIACIVVPLGLVLTEKTHPLILISSAALLLSIRPLKILYLHPPGSIYNQVLGQTGMLLLIFSIVFSIGLLL
ncbi:MAG: 1,4-dihydroxy-2-naphthoate polyprenyltransferase [Calditrichaeota bacterium]|nr:MAG: 1,4-dihydroxy-2-naphthoate polyprenyltransferase [Calditrichota bacterium]